MQTKVNIYNAPGVPGAHASINPIISLPVGRKAGTNVPFGGFCWDDPEVGTLVIPSGEGKPIGFVVREVTNTIVNVNDESQDYVPKGENVSIALKGDFYVKAEFGCGKGQKVFAKLEDGSVAAGDAGEEMEGYIETDYVFFETVPEGGVAIISNY